MLVKERYSGRIGGLASMVRASRQNPAFFFVFLSLLPPEGATIFRAGLCASDNLIKTVPHRSAWQLVFSLILDAVRRTAKPNCHNTVIKCNDLWAALQLPVLSNCAVYLRMPVSGLSVLYFPLFLSLQAFDLFFLKTDSADAFSCLHPCVLGLPARIIMTCFKPGLIAMTLRYCLKSECVMSQLSFHSRLCWLFRVLSGFL